MPVGHAAKKLVGLNDCRQSSFNQASLDFVAAGETKRDVILITFNYILYLRYAVYTRCFA